MNLNGVLIRSLVEKLPPHVFDEIVDTYPELLEGEDWYDEYYHWEPFIINDTEQSYESICEDYGLDPEDPEMYCQEFEDGVLIIE